MNPRRYLEHITDHLKKTPRGADYPRSVFATFSTAIAQAQEQAPGAAGVLCFAASFAPDAIPDELFRQHVEIYPESLRSTVADDLRVDEALGALDRLSLLAYAPASRTYAMHRLVQVAAGDAIPDDVAAWCRCAVAVADSAFPEGDVGTAEIAAWAQWERLLPHARAALAALPSDAVFAPAGRLAGRCAVHLRERGEYAVAEPLQQYAVATFEEASGADHPDTATALNNLATLRWRQGRFAQAEALLRRAADIREKSLGPEHPDVASSLNELALVCHDLGRFEEAEGLYKRALTIWERSLGAENAHYANALNNVAAVYRDQGRYDEAVELHTRALAIRERVLGANHPSVALSLNNLAAVYRRQQRYEAAERLFLRAIAIWEESLGHEHPGLALSLNNLAAVYREQKRYEEAESLFERALSIREKTLGPGHPDFAQTLHTFAVLYRDLGRFAQAKPLLKRALRIQEAALGPDHRHTAASRKELAATDAAEAAGVTSG